jgi:hypothetical protein
VSKFKCPPDDTQVTYTLWYFYRRAGERRATWHGDYTGPSVVACMQRHDVTWRPYPDHAPHPVCNHAERDHHQAVGCVWRVRPVRRRKRRRLMDRTRTERLPSPPSQHSQRNSAQGVVLLVVTKWRCGKGPPRRAISTHRKCAIRQHHRKNVNGH